MKVIKDAIGIWEVREDADSQTSVKRMKQGLKNREARSGLVEMDGGRIHSVVAD